MRKPAIDLSGLSPAERLDLLEYLWESIRNEDPAVTEAQRTELRSRLGALERGELKTIPLEQALTAIRANRATGHP